MLSPRKLFFFFNQGGVIFSFSGPHKDSLPFCPVPSQAGYSPWESHVIRQSRQKALGNLGAAAEFSGLLYHSRSPQRAHTAQLAHLPTQVVLFAAWRGIISWPNTDKVLTGGVDVTLGHSYDTLFNSNLLAVDTSSIPWGNKETSHQVFLKMF